MKSRIPAVAWLGFAFGLVLTPARRVRAQVATISVQTTALGKKIPRDFVGLSLEVSESGQGLQALQKSQLGGASPPSNEQAQYALGRPNAPNEGFFQFMRNLGPGVLRLGGNSQDNTCWDPKQAPHPTWCQAVLRAGDLKLFSEAAESSGWRLILGVNLKQNSGAWALREITEGIAPNVTPQQLLVSSLGTSLTSSVAAGGLRLIPLRITSGIFSAMCARFTKTQSRAVTPSWGRPRAARGAMRATSEPSSMVWVLRTSNWSLCTTIQQPPAEARPSPSLSCCRLP